MKVEHYERNFEQNEILGLNDMNTDNYLTEEQKKRLAEMEDETNNNTSDAVNKD